MEKLAEHKEELKEVINATAEKSKETLRDFINNNTKFLGDALHSNNKVVSSIKNKFKEQSIEDSISNNLKSTFSKFIELTEETLESIANSYTKQMQLNVDFNSKLIDTIKLSNVESPEKLLKLIHENFESLHQLTIKNTKELINSFNKHSNLTVNFNEQFGENITNQIESLFRLQGKGLDQYTEWASDYWWKQSEAEAKN
jgi:hypothetical protein